MNLLNMSPDRTSRNPDRLVEAARATFDAIAGFNRETGRGVAAPVDFKQIERQERTWASCSDPAMKAALLRAIEGKIRRIRTVIQAKNAQTPSSATGSPPTK